MAVPFFLAVSLPHMQCKQSLHIRLMAEANRRSFASSNSWRYDDCPARTASHCLHEAVL